MMGCEGPPQPSLFYTSFNLDKRIGPNHPLRKATAAIDFGFVSDEVGHLYGTNANVSVPPSVLLKLLDLLMLYNVRSEQEMMDRKSYGVGSHFLIKSNKMGRNPIAIQGEG